MQSSSNNIDLLTLWNFFYSYWAKGKIALGSLFLFIILIFYLKFYFKWHILDIIKYYRLYWFLIHWVLIISLTTYVLFINSYQKNLCVLSSLSNVYLFLGNKIFCNTFGINLKSLFVFEAFPMPKIKKKRYFYAQSWGLLQRLPPYPLKYPQCYKKEKLKYYTASLKDSV